LANNNANAGGGISNDLFSTLVLTNNVIANSTGGNLSDLEPFDSMITGNNNLIDDSSISVLSGSNNPDDSAPAWLSRHRRGCAGWRQRPRDRPARECSQRCAGYRRI
jgi:hypothetical protein